MKKPTERTEIIIRAKPTWQLLDMEELWRCRELFFILAWRDIRIRYKQTVIGVAWALFQPLINMIIFSFFFGKVANIPSGNLPYPLFVLCGLVYWTFFSNALTNASNSLIINEDIIKKVYFPKMIAPIAAIGPAFLEFGINLILLFIVAFWYVKIPSPFALLVIPLTLFVTCTTTVGLGLFLSAVNVKYRDVRFILPFFIQLLLFVSPIIYPTTILLKTHLYLVALNPMTGVVDAVRTVMSGNTAFNYPILAISCVSSVVILLVGLFYFNKTERFFADII